MAAIFCPFCGTQVPQEETNCTKCGASLEGDIKGSTLMGISTINEDIQKPAVQETLKPHESIPPPEKSEEDFANKTQKFHSPPAHLEESEESIEEESQSTIPVAKARYEENSWKEQGESQDGSQEETEETEDYASSDSYASSDDWTDDATGDDLASSSSGFSDSLILRPGDTVDPVTGLPLRAFRQKPKSKMPYVIFAFLTVIIVSLGFYVYTRPEPPAAISLSEQFLSLVGEESYELVIDISKVVGVDAIRVKEVQSTIEAGQEVRLSLPEESVPLGASTITPEAQIDGEWRPTVPLAIFRPAKILVTTDKTKELIILEFDVAEGVTAIKLSNSTEEVKVNEGKARVEVPIRKLVAPGEEKETTRTLSFDAVGSGKRGQVLVKVAPPGPTITLKTPKDYQVVEKTVEEIPLEFTQAPNTKAIVKANGKELTQNAANKYMVPLKPNENLIEIQISFAGKAIATETLHVFRGKAPEDWDKSKEGKGEKTP